MKIEAANPEEYINQLQEPVKSAIASLREAVRRGLPAGFQETMQYGMITWVVPHAIYPAGYRANPKDPLPFLSIAAQKNHRAVPSGAVRIPEASRLVPVGLRTRRRRQAGYGQVLRSLQAGG